MVLYIFISHQGNINNCYDRIAEMMVSNFIIIQGGFSRDFYDKDRNVLNLNCNDGYVGLPEKVMKTFHYILSDNTFDKYTHFVKLDDDMIVNKEFEELYDYAGLVHYGDGNRKWHMGRTNTFWDNLPYQGEFAPWCMGGYGYIISRLALQKVVPNFEYLNHIYEDVYIGLLMKSVGIIPIKINTKDYMVSPDH
jgi:hypothetical protein